MSSIFINVEGCEEKQEAASKMVKSNTVLTQVWDRFQTTVVVPLGQLVFSLTPFLGNWQRLKGHYELGQGLYMK